MVGGQYREDVITLIGVAFMQKHHGYERLIRGLREYYRGKKEKRVELLLIGEGPEKASYQRLVRKYKLQNHVKFYSTKSGKELDAMYDMSDVALASFGMYKLGIYSKLSALKTRECLAKGMPIITGCSIDVLDENYKYVKNFSNDAQIIDIEEIIAFFENIRNRS